MVKPHEYSSETTEREKGRNGCCGETTRREIDPPVGTVVKHLYLPGEGGREGLPRPSDVGSALRRRLRPAVPGNEGGRHEGAERSEPPSDHLIILDLPAGFLRR